MLRKRDLFKEVALKGKRLNCRLLHCKYLMREEAESPLQVAFKVPARLTNAVRRNRLKRLMREGFSKERAVLDVALANANTRVLMFFTFSDAKDIPIEQLKLNDVQPEVGLLCRTIAQKVNEAR